MPRPKTVSSQTHLPFLPLFIGLATLLCGILVGLVYLPARSEAAAEPHTGSRALQPDLGEWTLVPPVTSTLLHDVHMVSSADGWVVGDGGTVLRYNGSQWQSFPISTTDDLIDVFMFGPTNGYIIGRGPSGGQIFHWDGSAWSWQYDAPSELTRMHGNSPNNIWAVGLNISVHWNGTQWTVVPIPVQRQVFAVWSVSDTEAWAVGQYEPVSNSGLIMHYTGGQWVQVTSPSPQTLFDCFFTSPTDGWTVGYGVDIYRYNGAQWSFAYTNTLQLSRLFMLSPTDGWGLSEISNAIAHYDGTQWTQVDNPGPIGTYPEGIYMLSPQEGWIVGGQGLMLHYVDTSTPTPTLTATRTATASPTVTATRTPCTISFSDVYSTDYFYEAVTYLTCHGAISGYSDGTFRPYNNTTRGQLSKIVVLAEGWTIDTSGGPHFTDVQPNNPFYAHIETAYNHQVISGYSDGTFRWGNNVTRAQLSKIIVVAQQWQIDTSGGPHFTDVPASYAFYGYIETAYNRGIISGYSDGTFRPGNNATRGQIAKIVYNAVTAP